MSTECPYITVKNYTRVPRNILKILRKNRLKSLFLEIFPDLLCDMKFIQVNSTERLTSSGKFQKKKLSSASFFSRTRVKFLTAWQVNFILIEITYWGYSLQPLKFLKTDLITRLIHSIEFFGLIEGLLSDFFGEVGLTELVFFLSENSNVWK